MGSQVVQAKEHMRCFLEDFWGNCECVVPRQGQVEPENHSQVAALQPSTHPGCGGCSLCSGGCGCFLEVSPLGLLLSIHKSLEACERLWNQYCCDASLQLSKI